MILFPPICRARKKYNSERVAPPPPLNKDIEKNIKKGIYHAHAQRRTPVLAPEAGGSMKQKLLEMVQVIVLFNTDGFIFVWSFKNGNGCQNHSSGYFEGRVPKLSSRVTLATSGAGMSVIWRQSTYITNRYL